MNKVSLAAAGNILFMLVAGCAGAPEEVAADEAPAPAEQVATSHEEVARGDTVDPARELMITALSVVEDPVRTVWPADRNFSNGHGVWTFGYLMKQLAGTQDLSDFTLRWLNQWNADQTVNGDLAPARPLIHSLVIDPWLQASGGTSLDMSLAPFRLLAIVNRVDLRSNDASGLNGGEGRFVFGVTDPTGKALNFTVIFEFGLPIRNADDIVSYGKAWHALGSVAFGPAYNAQLQQITDVFTSPLCSANPNATCLHQLRTNEVILAADGSDPGNVNGKLWELREFHVSPGGVLQQTTTAQNPAASLNGSVALANLLGGDLQAARGRTLTVPASMLGAAVPAPAGGVWNAPGVDGDARAGFAVNTCGGCHTSETGTRFLHVKNRAPGSPAALSGFLTGITLPDPVNGTPRTFGDLARRGDDLLFVASTKGKDLFGPTKPKKPKAPH
jgi:hypothetical protein